MRRSSVGHEQDPVGVVGCLGARGAEPFQLVLLNQHWLQLVGRDDHPAAALGRRHGESCKRLAELELDCPVRAALVKFTSDRAQTGSGRSLARAETASRLRFVLFAGASPPSLRRAKEMGRERCRGGDLNVRPAPAHSSPRGRQSHRARARTSGLVCPIQGQRPRASPWGATAHRRGRARGDARPTSGRRSVASPSSEPRRERDLPEQAGSGSTRDSLPSRTPAGVSAMLAFLQPGNPLSGARACARKPAALDPRQRPTHAKRQFVAPTRRHPVSGCA